LAKVVGQATAEKLCYNATLASPQQALSMGLVDQVPTYDLLSHWQD